MKKIKSLLLSVLSLMSLVGVAQPCTVLADETQSTDINIETQAANIDITIPSTLEWTFNADGTNTLPDNWRITNNSAVDVMLDTVTINGESGWSLVNEQPTVDNTKAVVLTIDNVSQSNGVYTLNTELAKNGGTHKLSYDVKRANFTSNGIVNSQKAYTATLAFSYSEEKNDDVPSGEIEDVIKNEASSDVSETVKKELYKDIENTKNDNINKADTEEKVFCFYTDSNGELTIIDCGEQNSD